MARRRRAQRPDPYRVWLSEILLQQTTGAAAAPYFLRFVARWPRVEGLAAASLDEVIEAFAGLGYYARARNLHACAQEIARRGGRFPTSEAGLRALPGVGAYTAGAVAAIAFGERTAAVDGNVARILARLSALPTPIAASRREIAEMAQALVPADRPGDFAQALMDLGAMVCRPRNPACGACPLFADCAAAQAGEAERYPRRATAKARPVRYGAAYFAFRADGAFLARRRPPKGLLGATLELPGGAMADGGSGRRGRGAPLRRALAAIAGRSRAGVHPFHAAADALRCDDRGGSRMKGEGLFWVGAEEAAQAGFSSVMLKAIAHARAGKRKRRSVGVLVTGDEQRRRQHDLHVEPQRPIVDVIEIVVDARLHVFVVADFAAQRR